MRNLEIAGFSRARRQLSYTARLGDLQFSTSFWYDTVDFYELEERYGADLVQRIYFHIVAFDINRLVSLKPDTVNFGCFERFVTPGFAVLWKSIVNGVWAQWRFENNLPSYTGPTFCPQTAEDSRPLSLPAESNGCRSLAFCGGGKDSLLAMRLLEAANEPFDSLVYSHSAYGSHSSQHQIIDRLLAHCKVVRRHRIWITDDFLSCPVISLCPELGVRSVTAAETPAAAFAALPVALANSLRYLILAHEKSADAGNMIWPVTGEEINHQWGKSLEAERLISCYIRERLLSNVSYCSILKPIHDPVIFSSLTGSLDAVRFTHSCNVEKPWCGKCAKCAYVWLNYCAHFPETLVEEIFGQNLFDREENELWFRQLLGLEEHTPFECVGQVEETRLAFELCRIRGYKGRAMDLYSRTFPHAPAQREVESLFRVHCENQQMPADLASKVLPVLISRAESSRTRVWSKLGWTLERP